jgi:hypothetical protein
MSLEEQVGDLVTAVTDLTTHTETILQAQVAKVVDIPISNESDGTITAVTHGCGITVSLKAFNSSGIEEKVPYARDGNGDITWQSNPPFTGVFHITGVLN